MDGTLLRTDLLWESLVRLLKTKPLQLLRVVGWCLRGRAFLKQQLARVAVNPSTLPYNEELLAYLRQQQKAGRRLILATASDVRMAEPVARHLGIFDEVLASDGHTNLRGANKLRVLIERFGTQGFDYAGNSSVDLAVWCGARQAIVVNASPRLARRASRVAALGPEFPAASSTLGAFFSSLRPHQWVKNAIILIPALAGHRLGDLPMMVRDLLAFGIFCCSASGAYMINDLMDLDGDRIHHRKRLRPFASGALPLPFGLVAGPGLLAAGLLAAFTLSLGFAAIVALYLALTMGYSWWIRRVVLLDVFVLAGLYTVRLVAGHTATGIEYSAWLLMFSMFIFLSLALVKRYVELSASQAGGRNEPVGTGRGYSPDNLHVVTSLGTSSGYFATLVLALYVNSEQVLVLYKHPLLLLLVCPLLLYWISRVWLLAHRGEVHDNPVVFALKDRVSYAVGALMLVVVWLATGL